MSGDAENVLEIGEPEIASDTLRAFLRKRSPQIGQLVAALASAQLQFEPLHKGSDNPFFKSRYADLSQVIAATRKALADNGLVVMQTPVVRDKLAGVVSILAHKSGEWIEDELLLPAGVAKFDAQTVGSAITYARRYSYQALIGVAAEEDDDANDASGNTGSKAAAQAVAARKIAEHANKLENSQLLAEHKIVLKRPPAFNGHYIHVSGYLDIPELHTFFSDTASKRFKSRDNDSVYWRVPADYEKSLLELCARLTIEVEG